MGLEKVYWVGSGIAVGSGMAVGWGLSVGWGILVGAGTTSGTVMVQSLAVYHLISPPLLLFPGTTERAWFFISAGTSKVKR